MTYPSATPIGKVIDFGEPQHIGEELVLEDRDTKIRVPCVVLRAATVEEYRADYPGYEPKPHACFYLVSMD